MKPLLLTFLILVWPAAVCAQERYALLIGNEAYDGQSLTILENPHEDVDRIAVALKDAGFEDANIVVVKDANQQEIDSAFRQFESQMMTAGEDGIGFVYYSGHGATFSDGLDRGAYMIPVDEEIACAEHLPTEAVSIENRINRLSRAAEGSIFFVIDACRNELPFCQAKSAGAGVKGIGSVSAPPGLLVAFAAADGYFADDDSTFSKILAEEIRQPGQRADVAFLNVSSRVGLLKNDRTKTPVIQPQLGKDICFVSCEASEEDLIWSMLKQIGAYESYLQRYPNGKYADEAKELAASAPSVFGTRVAATAPPSIEFDLAWDWHFGDEDNDIAFAVAPTPDGGFAMAGMLGTGSDGSQDAIIVAFDADGEELWRRRLDGTKHDVLRAMTALPSGYAAAGYKWRGPAGRRSDAWVIRLDENGNTLWERTFGGMSDDWAYGITAMDNGGLALAGWTSSAGAGGRDILIWTLNSSGTKIAERTLGGPGDEEARAITTLRDGTLLVVGWTKSNSPSGEDMGIWFLDENLEETNRLAISRGGREIINGVAPLDDGGVVLVGMADRPGTQGEDFWVLKLDQFGTTQFDRVFGGDRKEVAEDVITLDDGTIVVAGLTASKGGGWYDMWLIGLSPTGDLLWDKTVGEQKNEFANDITQLTDGSLAVVGVTQSKGPAKDNLYAVKLEPSD